MPASASTTTPEPGLVGYYRQPDAYQRGFLGADISFDPAKNAYCIDEPGDYITVAGPMVVNQFSGSDGDIFSHAFSQYKLGPLVGTRTWGGVIGISAHDHLVDGTLTTQPEYAFWFSDVGWQVENHGVDPDYLVETTPQDYREGKDPQLSKAVELGLAALKAQPVQLPHFDNRPSKPLPAALP